MDAERRMPDGLAGAGVVSGDSFGADDGSN